MHPKGRCSPDRGADGRTPALKNVGSADIGFLPLGDGAKAGRVPPMNSLELLKDSWF
jgi:hypothetical protein